MVRETRRDGTTLAYRDYTQFWELLKGHQLSQIGEYSM